MKKTSGLVTGIFRWPVKSMAGEQLHAAAFDDRGMVGDRDAAIALREQEDRALTLLTARRDRWLLGWSAHYEGTISPLPERQPTVMTPTGIRFSLDDPSVVERLEEQSGRPLVIMGGGGHHDVPRRLHITLQATLDAFSADLGMRLDVRRFRPNLHVDMDVEPFGELAWLGRVLRFESGLILEVTEATGRCVIAATDPISLHREKHILQSLTRQHSGGFGVYARVRRPGVVRVEESFELMA